MNNNINPYFFPNQPPQQFNNFLNIEPQLKNIENRIYNLEKEIMKLQNKINKLENKKTPYSDNYTSNYQPNTYNMM